MFWFEIKTLLFLFFAITVVSARTVTTTAAAANENCFDIYPHCNDTSGGKCESDPVVRQKCASTCDLCSDWNPSNPVQQPEICSDACKVVSRYYSFGLPDDMLQKLENTFNSSDDSCKEVVEAVKSRGLDLYEICSSTELKNYCCATCRAYKPVGESKNEESSSSTTTLATQSEVNVTASRDENTNTANPQSDMTSKQVNSGGCSGRMNGGGSCGQQRPPCGGSCGELQRGGGMPPCGGGACGGNGFNRDSGSPQAGSGGGIFPERRPQSEVNDVSENRDNTDKTDTTTNTASPQTDMKSDKSEIPFNDGDLKQNPSFDKSNSNSGSSSTGGCRCSSKSGCGCSSNSARGCGCNSKNGCGCSSSSARGCGCCSSSARGFGCGCGSSSARARGFPPCPFNHGGSSFPQFPPPPPPFYIPGFPFNRGPSPFGSNSKSGCGCGFSSARGNSFPPCPLNRGGSSLPQFPPPPPPFYVPGFPFSRGQSPFGCNSKSGCGSSSAGGFPPSPFLPPRPPCNFQDCLLSRCSPLPPFLPPPPPCNIPGCPLSRGSPLPPFLPPSPPCNIPGCPLNRGPAPFGCNSNSASSSTGGCGCNSKSASSSTGGCGCNSKSASSPAGGCGCNSKSASSSTGGCGCNSKSASSSTGGCGCNSKSASSPAGGCGCNSKSSSDKPSTPSSGCNSAKTGENNAQSSPADGFDKFYAQMVSIAENSYAVSKLIESNKVMIFSRSTCPYCIAAKELLNRYNQKFNAIDYDIDRVKCPRQDCDALKRLVNQRFNMTTVPVIIIKGNLIGGNSDLQKLDQNGELGNILQD